MPPKTIVTISASRNALIIVVFPAYPLQYLSNRLILQKLLQPILLLALIVYLECQIIFDSQFSVVSLIKVEYTLSDFHNELYPDYYPIIIFRVIQECLQNAVKHSRAGLIRINLVESAPFLISRYQDDGVGLNLLDPLSQCTIVLPKESKLSSGF